MTDARTKRSRPYNSRLRAEQAAATRERVVEAATALFAERGYAGTSMPEVARRAGVSTETVQAHGPKSALLRAAIDASAFGVGRDEDARDTDLGALMLRATTAQEAVAVAAEVLAQVNRATHGLWLAYSEAARTDDEIAAEFRALAGGIRMQNELLMTEWRSRGYARDDLEFGELVDRSILAGSVEVYDRAVRVNGMAFEEYRGVLAGMFADLIVVR
jgi:AcrR family transcriptional regulator